MKDIETNAKMMPIYINELFVLLFFHLIIYKIRRYFLIAYKSTKNLKIAMIEHYCTIMNKDNSNC